MPKSNQAPVGLFFEVVPNSGHLHHYFSYVEKLKPELEKHKGLIWLNRYEAQLDDYSLLSHQLWDSEKSLKIGGKINSIAWRKRLALRSISKITEFELDRG